MRDVQIPITSAPTATEIPTIAPVLNVMPPRSGPDAPLCEPALLWNPSRRVLEGNSLVVVASS